MTTKTTISAFSLALNVFAVFFLVVGKLVRLFAIKAFSDVSKLSAKEWALASIGFVVVNGPIALNILLGLYDDMITWLTNNVNI